MFLKGRGLNLELSLDAHVTGSTADPRLTGTAQVVRGDYDFAGKRFQFDNRGVVYLATAAEDIRLDLTATRDDPSLTAVIRIEGTAAKPKITLTSTPVLPNDEVLSQVLFGTSASQLSPLDAAELASAMTSLAGGVGLRRGRQPALVRPPRPAGAGRRHDRRDPSPAASTSPTTSISRSPAGRPDRPARWNGGSRRTSRSSAARPAAGRRSRRSRCAGARTTGRADGAGAEGSAAASA